MLNLASSTSSAKPCSETRVQSLDSTKDLAARFTDLIDNADDRVRLMREKALFEFSKREERIDQFAKIQKRLERIICDGLGVLTSQSVFSDAKLTCSDGIGSTAATRSNGSATSITLPISAKRHKQMQFSFHVFHDTEVENAIVEYRLQMVPVLIRFVAHDQFSIPIADEIDAGVVDWVGAKLVGMVETYFDVLFHPEYQKPHLVTDPVLGIQFPKSMAAGTRERDGTIIHFFTEESFRLFNDSPSRFIGTLFGSTVQPSGTTPVLHRNE